MKKIIVGITLIAIAFGFVMIGVVTFNTLQAEESYVCVDINPSVEFVVNRNEIVVRVNALDADAELVLNGLTLVDKNVEEATELFVAAATELGYINSDATEENPNAVLISVLNLNNRSTNALKAKLMNRIDGYMLNNGIWGIAFSSEDMAAIITEAETLGISAGKLRMIKAVQISYPEKTTEELASLSIKELVELVKAKNPAETLITNYQNRLAELNAIAEVDRTAEQTQEIAEITAKLANINELRLKVQEDRAALKASQDAKNAQHVANREAKRQAIETAMENFRNNIQSRIQEIFQNHFQRDFD
ncbi:MAG: hypothetical protein WCR30_02760 [Clostridia bacterium]